MPKIILQDQQETSRTDYLRSRYTAAAVSVAAGTPRVSLDLAAISHEALSSSRPRAQKQE